jgi:hypothetical protein
MTNTFSVEAKSRDYITSVVLNSSIADQVLIEGDLGKILDVSFIEGKAIEVVGEHGVLRLDLNEERIRALFSKESSK